MEQMQQNTVQPRLIEAEQQKRIEQVCFHSLGLISRNCEYLDQHLARIGADQATRQAVADINAAAVQIDRVFSETMTLMEFLRGDEPPQLYPVDLCELLRQIAAQADMIREQLAVEIELDYGGWTSCCVQGNYSDAELLCLHLLSNALRACREGSRVRLALRRGQASWQMTVTDNGCGLPGGDPESVLENRRSFLGGAQLGLLICRECCRRMGWGLQVEPAAECGTQAVVTIPLYVSRDQTGGTVELCTESELTQEQRRYHLRAMLVREMRTMPDRGEPEE